MFVYVIVCRDSLKLYIGQHKGCDLPQYLRSKWYSAHHRLADRSRLYAAMRKYPREAWSIHPLVSGLQTREEVDQWEKFYIEALKSQHPNVGYNLCRGGEGFTGPHSERARQKMSRKIKASYVRRGRAESEKRSEQSCARWANPEFRQRVSEIQKQTPNAGRFQRGCKPSPLSGAKGPNRTSFGVGHKPWNTGTKGKVKPNAGSFGYRSAENDF